MNICLFSFSFLPRIGGMEWVVHDLANALSILGHNVVVLTKKIKEKDLEIKKFYKLEKFGFTFKGATKLGFDFISFLFSIHRIIKKYNIEVINFHSAAYSGTFVVKYKEIFNKSIPIVATLHGADIQVLPEVSYGYCLDKNWRKKIKNVLDKSDAIISISESVKEDIKKTAPEVENKIYDIPNGIWLDVFLNHKIKIDIRKRFNLPNNSIVIISVGRNHIKKGFEYGIKAMKIITQKFNNVYYVIIGRETEKLFPLVKDLGLEDKVILASEIRNKNELIDCYKTTDIYLSPSLIEGFSLTNLEAMASGLACVVTDVPGNRDVIKNNCGILVQPYSEQAIAEKIEQLILSPSLMSELRQRALEEIKNYDWIAIANKYVKVYIKAVDKK
jgi:glycosyltransferase involved in cell wall biosynthesis